MALSEHQEDVKNQALEILETSKRLLIKGSAGTGKTYMVDELVKELSKAIPKYKLIYCSAPTNKAVTVLSGKINQEQSNINLITTHKALKIGAKTDKDTGIKNFEPILSTNPKYHPLVGVSLFIIDETSMIGQKMLDYIEEYATNNKTLVIFIGDVKQLFPVKESHSPVFFQDYPEVELTEIVRQGAGNPIIHLSRNLSDIWDLETRLTDDGKGFVYTNDRDKIITKLAEVNGTDELKYLSWTNADVDQMNKDVREKIYGEPSKIELGETLMFNEPYGEYFVNQEIKVKTLDVIDISFKLVVEDMKNFVINDVTLKCYVINGKQVDEWGDGKLRWRGVFILHENAEEQFKNLMKFLTINCAKKKLKWTTKNTFEDQFAKITYNHAMTVHTSQGSTYRQAVVNIGLINRSPSPEEKERLLYTAITRASDLLILYNVI